MGSLTTEVCSMVDSLSRSMGAAGTWGRISTTTDPCRVSSPWASQLEDQSHHLCQLVFFLIRSRHRASVGMANSVSMQRWCVALDSLSGVVTCWHPRLDLSFLQLRFASSAAGLCL